jgi:probable O-glycosylation ligase (exosortase A-associated)
VPGYAFAAVVVFAFIDYARPQDVLPILGTIRPSLLITALLAGLLVFLKVPINQRRPQLMFTLLVFMACWVPLARNNFFALAAFRGILQLTVFCLALGAFVDTPSRLRKFTAMWLVTLTFQGVWGITHGGRGTGGVFWDENDVALALTIGLPFTYFLIRFQKAVTMRIALGVGMASMLGGIVASNSRGGFVGLLSVALFTWLMSKHKLRLIALGFVAAGFLALVAPAKYWDEMRTITDDGESTRVERIESWTIGWRAFMDNPVFGVGPGNINWHMTRYEDFNPNKKSLGGRATHSLYFTLIPEMGLIGIVLYVWLIQIHFKSITNTIRICSRAKGALKLRLRYTDACARASLCGTVAYLICGIFLSVLYYPHLYYLIAMSFAIERIAKLESARFNARNLTEPAALPSPEVAALPEPERTGGNRGLAKGLLK